LDIYVQTSLWEGMPVAVIEAQVAGVPAVVTDILGNRDVVRDGETGFVCRHEEEMVAQLVKLIREPKVRVHMGQQARRFAVTRFSIERLLDELLDAYQAVVR
jgi:glycosyltransferase involved in cell wall biosynthesis